MDLGTVERVFFVDPNFKRILFSIVRECDFDPDSDGSDKYRTYLYGLWSFCLRQMYDLFPDPSGFDVVWIKRCNVLLKLWI